MTERQIEEWATRLVKLPVLAVLLVVEAVVRRR
jgi:hypothetical protein